VSAAQNAHVANSTQRLSSDDITLSLNLRHSLLVTY